MAQLVRRSGTARLESGLGRSVYREFIGSASGNTLKLTGTFTANREATFPDTTDTLAELGQANTFTVAVTQRSGTT